MANEKRTLIDKIFGLTGKREWRELESRAKKLPLVYYKAYKNMQRYMWTMAVVSKWSDSKFAFERILDLLEEAVSEGKSVTDVTGPDVAAFCDGLSSRDETWRDKQRSKLNKKFK